MESYLYDLYERLMNTPGAPGFEDEVRQLMRQEMKPFSDEIIQDHLGSIFGVRYGAEAGPKVMVAGHMDEVGFMVTQITSQGFLRLQPLGGWWNQVLLAQRFDVITEQGVVPGVIGSTPPHNLSPEQRKKPVEVKHMFLDIGADDQDDALKLGIKPGQQVTPVSVFTPMANPKKIMGKAWDNRFGCGLAIELLRQVQHEQLPGTLYSGAHVQEEVGLRGAQTSAKMIQPDIFFAVDAGPAGDLPGVENGMGRLGEGALLRIYDRSMITHRGLRDFILDTAEAGNIPYQYFTSQGGTDAGRVHISGEGVPSAVIGLSARYIHSHAAIAHIDDIDAATELLVTLVKKLDHGTLDRIRCI